MNSQQMQLGLSEHTIKKYLLRIFDKLGISTRVELVLYAVCENGRQNGCRAVPDEKILSCGIQLGARRKARRSPLDRF